MIHQESDTAIPWNRGVIPSCKLKNSEKKSFFVYLKKNRKHLFLGTFFFRMKRQMKANGTKLAIRKHQYYIMSVVYASKDDTCISILIMVSNSVTTYIKKHDHRKTPCKQCTHSATMQVNVRTKQFTFVLSTTSTIADSTGCNLTCDYHPPYLITRNHPPSVHPPRASLPPPPPPPPRRRH